METKRFGSAAAAGLALGMLLAGGTWAAVGDIVTIAGTGVAGFSGDGGPATSAQLNTPLGVVKDSAGNTYIADMGNNRIRKIDTSGIITTVAGDGTWGYSGDGGPAISASLKSPYAVAVDLGGNIFIADTRNNRIRKVDTSGIITTVAGNGTQGFSGDGGPATAASFWAPYGIAIDSAGNIYIADTGDSVVRKVDTSGVITSIISPGAYGIPYGVAVDSAGNVYFTDAWNTHKIYKVAPSGSVSAVAGNGSPGYSGDGGSATSASLNLPTGVAVDPAGNIYIADNGNNRIRKVDTGGIITTVAGNGTAGYSGNGGPATAAAMKGPFGVAIGSIRATQADNHVLSELLTAADITGAATLTVAKLGTGSGSVSSGLNINCGTDCTKTYDTGAKVTLVATPDAGSTFTGWIMSAGAGECLGTGACSVTMDVDKIVTAMFDTALPKIAVNPAELNFGKVLVGTKSAEQTVTVTNIGEPGSFLLIADVGASMPFIDSSACTSPLARGASCAISVALHATSIEIGYLKGLLHIISNDVSVPHLVFDLAAAPVPASTSSVPTSVASPNSTISNQSAIDPGTLSGLPADFAPDCALSFTATGVNGSAEFGILCDSITSSSKAYKKRSDGSFTEIYPTNQCGGIEGVSVADGLMLFRITDNSDCDLNSATGTIDDPIIIGRVVTGSGTVSMVTGWNLLGNSASAVQDVAAAFGDSAKVTTVWKWIASSAKWAFYSPQLTDGGAAYAASKGYDALTSIAGGEGFWVNAKTSFSAQLPAGTAVGSASFQSMSTGWNLIAAGDSPTPSTFNKALSATQPAAGEIPLNLTTLWAWDATQSNWYFYAPSLEKNGTLSAYIQSKSYLDFGTKVLDPAMGFWVNKP